MNTLKALWANALLWLIRPALEERDRRKAETQRLYEAECQKYWDGVRARRADEQRKEKAEWDLAFAPRAARRAARAAESSAVPRVQ